MQNIWRKNYTELTYIANTTQKKRKLFSRDLKGEKKPQESFADNGTEERITNIYNMYLWLLNSMCVSVCAYICIYTYISILYVHEYIYLYAHKMYEMSGKPD